MRHLFGQNTEIYALLVLPVGVGGRYFHLKQSQTREDKAKQHGVFRSKARSRPSFITHICLVSSAAVIRIVTQRFSPTN